jgi:hypothetical protein
VVDSRLQIQKSGIANIKGNKISTIVNEKIVKGEVRTHAGLVDKLTNISRNKHRKCTHKVLISGDSHLKGISENNDQFVNTKVSVCSFIKPGASINQIVSLQENEFKKLGNNDVIVVSGGTNDMDNNCDKGSKVLKKMTKFMQSYNNTNIVIMNIPHRYDLEKNSKINLKIQKVNRKLKKMLYRFGHVTLLETDTERKFYTKHGLHLNKKGKDVLARSIANLIQKLILNEDKGKKGIILDWKGVINVSEIALNSIQECDDKISNRTSMRKKKPPVTRKNYFLWPKV